MKCPNCGKNVRSKKQCAHCGYVFGNDDLKHSNHENANEPVKETIIPEDRKINQVNHEEVKVNKRKENKKEIKRNAIHETDDFNHVDIVPKTPRKKGGFLKFLWNIIKLVLMVGIVFLAFMYGPQIVNKVSDVFHGKAEISSLVPNNKKETESETTLQETEESTQKKSELSLASGKADIENYPVVNVTLDFNEPLDKVDNKTFTFKVKNGNDIQELGEGYSLVKKGKTLRMSYTDPNIAASTGNGKKQILMVESSKLNFSEEIQYDVPENKVDKKQSEQFNEIINNNLSELGSVSAMVQKVNKNDKASFVYEDESVEAGELIAWYIAERSYEAIKDGTLTLDQVVKVNPELIAQNDSGEMASAGEEAEYTVEELITLIIQQKDITAMNHLIQETGGPNAFNLWLNESSYFSTKVTKILGYDENGQVTGAVTNAQNIVYLLNELANNKLIDEEYDTKLKEQILQSPITTKYPEILEVNVNNRYELATNDANTKSQYYSAIIETENSKYLVTILVSDFTNVDEVVPAISNTIKEIIEMLENGSNPDETTTENEETEASAEEQVQIESDNNQNQPGANDEYSYQNVNGSNEQILLPIIRDEAGNPIQVNWYYDEASGMYQY